VAPDQGADHGRHHVRDPRHARRPRPCGAGTGPRRDSTRSAGSDGGRRHPRRYARPLARRGNPRSHPRRERPEVRGAAPEEAMTSPGPLALAVGAVLALSVAPPASAQAPVAPEGPAAAPEGRITFAVTITLAPTWFDPAETAGVITPFL